MSAHRSMIVLLGTCVLGAVALGGRLASPTEVDEVVVDANELPPVIRSALVGIHIAEAERAWSEGREVYFVEFRAGGAEVELKLSRQGQLLAVEVESADDEPESDPNRNDRGDKADDDDESAGRRR